jgi:hypothetical protein
MRAHIDYASDCLVLLIVLAVLTLFDPFRTDESD